MGISLPWKIQSARLEPQFEVDPELLFEPQEPEVEIQVSAESDWIWRPLFLLTLVGIFFALGFTGAKQYVAWLDRPIEQVFVEGATRHIDKALIQQRVQLGLNQTLLSVDLVALQEALVADPWINEASIRRTWPPAIDIALVEEVPVARWGERGLLNHQGDIFWPELKAEYANLPRLIGPSHETVRIMQQFHDLNSLFARFGLHLSGLELESRGAWHLELDNGMKVVAGREDLMPRLRRFIQVYETQLADKVDQIEEVDIRYTNGVAVRWKQTAELAQNG